MKFASVEPQALQHPNWYVTTFSLSPLYDELCLYITIFLVPLMSETLTSLDDLNGLLIASNPSRILVALLCLDIWLTTTFCRQFLSYQTQKLCSYTTSAPAWLSRREIYTRSP